MFTAYIIGATITAAIIGRANRITGQNYLYLSAATIGWPVWMTMYGLTNMH